MSFLDQINGDVSQADAGKLESLPDGEYTFVFCSARYKEIDNAKLQGVALEAMLEVDGGDFSGTQVKYDTIVKDGAGAKRLRATLVTLGFDANAWTLENNLPFTEQLKKAAGVLPGIKFHGKKARNESGGKTYHNLYINKRALDDGRPAAFTSEDLDKPAGSTFDALPF